MAELARLWNVGTHIKRAIRLVIIREEGWMLWY